MDLLTFTLHDDSLFGLRAITAYLAANHIEAGLAHDTGTQKMNIFRMTLPENQAEPFVAWFRDYVAICGAHDEVELMATSDPVIGMPPQNMLPSDWAVRFVVPFEDEWLTENDPERLDGEYADPRSAVLENWAKATKHWDKNDSRCRKCGARLNGFWECTQGCH